jgi:hypothetical protein
LTIRQDAGVAAVAGLKAALGIVHHTLTEESTLRFVVDSSIKQAFTTQAPVAFILSPLLTGGNPAAHAQLT